MKIGFKLGLSKGGPAIFMARLKEALKKNNLVKTSFFFDPTIDLILTQNTPKNIWKKPYVLRLDNFFYSAHFSKKEYHKLNSPIIKSIQNSNGLVYQSKFSKFAINKLITVKKKIPNEIIHNGVDLKRFNKNGKNLRKNFGISSSDLVFITSASFRPIKRLNDIIKSFIAYDKLSLKKKYLIVLGGVNDKYKNFPTNIIFSGEIKHELLPDWYRTGDIFLFFSYIDACPNTVIEALATRLPILCTNLGGTKELVELTNGGIVVNADKPICLLKVNMLKLPKPNYKVIIQGIKKIVKLKNKISSEMNLNKIDINFVSKKYHRFIKNIKT
jgi:glycosyltransferase involved in cell wall biosynthesis|tara:strand:- start:201 stop:1184 length:984 start_codon:yes stop_codon:yes gene_type:complete